MFIYNVTVSLEKGIEEEWLQWMKEQHVPDVMKTGCFTESRMLKVFGPEEHGPTFSVQYMFKLIPDIERYQKEFAKKLQEEHKARFGDKATAFRTLLQILE